MGGVFQLAKRAAAGRTDHLRSVLVFVAIAGLVTTCGSPAPSTAPSRTATAGPSASASSSPAAQTGWSTLDLPPLARVATLEATHPAPEGVALDTAFRLTSLDGRDPRELAAHLVSEPALTLRQRSAGGAAIELQPAAPLAAGTIYRLSLRTTAGQTEAAWAVQAVKPLHVVSSIPGDQETGVPVNTGIEVAFDQLGVTAEDATRFVSIRPATPGRFELHARTVAFVPDKPLAVRTLYTIVVGQGLPLGDTGMTLQRDVTIRFETEASHHAAAHVTMYRPLFDAGTRDRAAISIRIDGDEGASGAVTRLSVKVHRLPGVSAAIEGWSAIADAPDWTAATGTAPIATRQLPLVLSGTVRLRTFTRESDWVKWFELPGTLRAGWYVVTASFDNVPRQAILQVTDLAMYAVVTTSRTVAWVNDIRSGDPVTAARVTIGGTTLGRTNRSGLLIAATPRRIGPDVGSGVAGDATAMIARKGGRAVFLPLAAGELCGACAQAGDGNDRWWHLLQPDRYAYRSTDTVNTWGVVRARDGGQVPGAVEVRLLAFGEDGEAAATPIVRRTAKPDARGAFAVELPFTQLPPGSYNLELRVGGALLAERGITVGPIQKPAWSMTMMTDRHAIIAGQRVRATIAASFFEGTPVSGAAIELSGSGKPVSVRTDAGGAASGTVTLALEDGDASQWNSQWVQARPTAPEEADISGGAPVAVFRASAIVDADSTLQGTQLRITGAVHDVAFRRYEVPGVNLETVDPRGAARPGVTVRVHVVEHIPVLRKTGTHYDFITKLVEPTWEVEDHTVDLGTRTLTTRADGTFRLARTVAGGSRTYETTASYTDEASRTVQAETTAWPMSSSEALEMAQLEAPERGDLPAYSIGETVRVSFRSSSSHTAGSRYLFVGTERGLRSATLTGKPRYATRFRASDVPGFTITAVRFTGIGYEVALGGYPATFRAADRRLRVELAPDSTVHAPGDAASVTVTTRDPAGRPVAASVFVRVIDEKLYAIGAAADADPIDELYAPVGDGRIATAWSHASPEPPFTGEGGDTTGGGGDERSDFRDWLVARLVRTDASGHATVRFDLSDDLTSWRIVGSAIDRRLEAGSGVARIAARLPFFAEATVAAEYLVADHPVVRVRAFGSGLAARDRVTFTVSSDTLPMAAVTREAGAFEAVEIPLPTLAVGDQRLRIEASTGSGGGLRRDVLVRTFRVVATRVLESQTRAQPLTGTLSLAGGTTGFTDVTLVDGGRGRVLPVLETLADTHPVRADQAIAAAVARSVLADSFGRPAGGSLPDDPDLSRFQQPGGGVGLLPYASSDLELSMLAALSGDIRINPTDLRTYFDDDQSAVVAEATRERALQILAARAGLGDDVLADVRAAAALPDLEPSEQVIVALAALASGDEELAGRLERELLAASGQRLGPWVRLNLGSADAGVVATARLAIIAAALGDPVAADMDAYLEANPPKDTVVDLERALAARRWAARVPAADARAAVTVDGERREVRIDASAPVRLVLTPAQTAGLRIEPVSGSVIVVSHWEAGLEPASLHAPEGQVLTRSVSPAGPIGEADEVVVTLRVTLGPDADQGCWLVTDWAPSGLAPIGGRSRWYDDEEAVAGGSEAPWRVVGQRVDFCVTRDPREPTQSLRYLAHVVTPGTYRWEPAVLQSSILRDQGVVLPAMDVEISGQPG